jgi:hypothetical protein
MSHAGRGGAACGQILIDNGHAQAVFGAFCGARQTHNAGAYDYDIVRSGMHFLIPVEKGSRGSRINSPWPLMKADPLMLG